MAASFYRLKNQTDQFTCRNYTMKESLLVFRLKIKDLKETPGNIGTRGGKEPIG